ncbi:MAG: hypothetical protein LBG99_08510 [Propionibacteriaceae bacterium]|jgi:hypothetical protein|nr:hypothetical protein [Propionibacteriaceae bacterium]
MKIARRLITFALACGIAIVAVPGATAHAGQLKATHGNTGFTSAWQLYTSGDSNRAALTYGFNTTAIHEDYAWANHSTLTHYASLKNGKGTYAGPTKSVTAVSKIEITHTAIATYEYYCNF